MGAEYLSDVKSIATFAPTFYDYIISVLASVYQLSQEGLDLLGLVHMLRIWESNIRSKNILQSRQIV